MRLNNKHGFSLIELMVVIAVIGIMAAIAVPNIMAWLPNMRLKAAARDLYSNMQKARMQAVKTNKNTAIIFDTANNKYDLCDDWSSGACNGTQTTLVNFSTMNSGVGYGHSNLTQSVSNDPNNPIPQDNVSYSSPVNTAFFNSRGLGNSGYVYLSNNKKTVYAVGSLSSGVIKLLKWQGSTWK